MWAISIRRYKVNWYISSKVKFDYKNELGKPCLRGCLIIII